MNGEINKNIEEAKKSVDVTVLVNSCDKYEDAWNPFFKLFNINWGNCPYPVILNTEKKNFECDYMKVQIINSLDEYTWSKRLLTVLKRITSEYVFLLLEDFFLDKPFNSDMFEKVLEYMKEHKEIGVTHVSHTNKPHEDTDELLWERKYDCLNIVITATLYRRDFLMKILRQNESPWDFEHYAGVRAKKTHYKVMQYNEKYPVIYSYNHSLYDGTAISEGKWMKKTKQLFDKYGIAVDYDNLSFCATEEAIVRPFKVSKEKSAPPGGLLESVYFYRKRIKKVPVKVKEWWFHIR